MRAPAPTATWGPIQTASPSTAAGSTAALGWTKGPWGRGGSSAASSAASATRTEATASTGLGYAAPLADQARVGQHGAGLGGQRLAQVARVDREGQRARVRLGDGRDPLDREARVAHDPAAGPLRELAERCDHGLGLGFSSILRIFSTSGVMSTPP